MGLFSSKKAEPELLPRTAESIYGGKWLQDLLKRGAPDYPTQNIAGLTEAELANQSRIGNILTNGTEGYNLAMDEVKRTLSGYYDPYTSDFYSGVRGEIEMGRERSISDAKRYGQSAGGDFRSIPTGRLVNEANDISNNRALQVLGGLSLEERRMMANAGVQAAQLGAQEFQQQAAGETLLEKPRRIDQAREDAIYNQRLQTMLAPYQLQAPIAQALLNYSPGTWVDPGGPSEFAKAAGVASTTMSLFGQAMTLGTLGGGNSNPGYPLPVTATTSGTAASPAPGNFNSTYGVLGFKPYGSP